MRSLVRHGAIMVAATLIAHGTMAGGNSTYEFLRNDVGARAAAMAGSFVSVVGDPNSLFYNPAGLSTLDNPVGSLGFFKHLLDINSGYVSYGLPLADVGNVAAGIVYNNYGSFDRTDEFANTLGSFNASDIVLALGYSNILDENLHYGVGLKFIYSSIAEYSSSGAAADFGLLYNIPDNSAAVGISIHNVGAQFSNYLADSKENLPLDIVVGGSIVPRGLPLLLNVNFHKLNEDVSSFGDRFRSFTVGGEFTLSRVLQLRFGYDNERRKELKIGTTSGVAGLSAGLGITVEQYKVDYAISALGKVGSMHRVSIASTF